MNKMLAIASGVLLACGSMAAQAVVLDNFSTPQGPIDVDGAPGQSDDCGARVDMGIADRCISAEKVGGDLGTSTAIAAGVFSHSNDVSNTGIGWADWIFHAPMDLSGDSTINVVLAAGDLTCVNANVPLTLELNGSSQTMNAGTAVGNVVSFPIVGLAALSTMRLTVDATGATGIDCSIDQIDTTTPPPPPPPVPAISTVGLIAALAGLPVLGAIGIRRRRRDDD